MLTMSRPARILSSEQRLGAECAAARWTYHRLLDFEDEHQRVLDATAEAIAPSIVRVGRIVSRLARRARWAERATEGSWVPNPRPELAKRLRARLAELRQARNADPRWKEACAWADTPAPDAPPRGGPRRRAGESDAEFAERRAKRRDRLTRREAYRAELYAQRRIYWGTWNALIRSADQARRDVLKRRAQGLPAEMRRPRYRDPVTLAADSGGFRIVERGPLWWVVELRLGTEPEWVRVRAKLGSWHAVPDGAQLRTAKLTRRKDGERWAYSLSLTAAMDKPVDWPRPEAGLVAFDWGHRAHGHALERQGVRAFVWLGSDGYRGEVILPRECRELTDEVDQLKSRMDAAFLARKRARGLPDRNRYGYRRRLMRQGVRTEEEARWLRWEMRYERQIARRRRRVLNLRRELYLRVVRELTARYARFAFEREVMQDIKDVQTDEQRPRRERSTRDLATRYEFVALCERFGAELIPVTSRNSTRECPDCGALLEKNGPELLVACPGCGTVRDKDEGAARVILRRAEEALANRAA